MRNEKIQIDRLKNAKTAIAGAIAGKGVDVPESTKLDGYPTLISQISTSGAAGGKSVRTCRVVVGTAVAGWTENDCDYLCDGINDVTIINDAIQAAPEGGAEIHLLDGSYSVASTINLKDNIMLTGNGVNTIFRCTGERFDNFYVFNVAANNCIIGNFQFTFSLTSRAGEREPPTIIGVSGNNNTIQNNLLSNAPENGIKLSGSNNNIINNTISDCSENGIKLEESEKNYICRNRIKGGSVGISATGNYMNISNNIITDFEGMAINIISGSYYTIAGNNINTINEAHSGIECGGDIGNILGNTISGTLLINTISLNGTSKNILISNNSLYKIDVKNSGYNNKVVNNKVIVPQAGGGTS